MLTRWTIGRTLRRARAEHDRTQQPNPEEDA